MKFETNYEMKAACLFRYRERRTILSGAVVVVVCLIYFILFHFFLGWREMNCLPFLWQYYSIYSGLAECVWLFCVSFEKMHASKSQPQAAFKSAVLSLLIVKMSERISDRWFKFIFELTATERSTTSGTVVWCVLGASRAKSWPVSKWVSE